MPLYLSYVVTMSRRSISPPSLGSNPFAVCPVAGAVRGYDGFGAPRYAGGYHPHAGIDMMADFGVPIVAPFPGIAVASPNDLGGNAVKVYGSHGYVYNAHLSRYGRLGQVRTGTVIGYVGDTGDARGGPPHDHFEWHPAALPASAWVSPYGYTVIGGAVDPFSYLLQVCR
jgi:murein DD-endopeptidase MepM/ murein hydrolase activator NlpD